MKSGLYAILAFVLGFVIAQVSKFLLGLGRKERKAYKNFVQIMQDLTKSGGMPSGHSSSFVALSTFLGLAEGFDSSVFALAVAMTVIIVYDAVNVRYAVGEHGKLLNEIARSDGNKRTNPQKLVEGHTVPQAVAGMLIGILVGLGVYYLL